MDIRYQICASGGVVLSSSELTAIPPDFSGSATAPPLLSDIKVHRSKSEIGVFEMKARGSCGVDPGPVRLRVTLSASMGDWLYRVRKRVVPTKSSMFSTYGFYTFGGVIVRGQHRSSTLGKDHREQQVYSRDSSVLSIYTVVY